MSSSTITTTTNNNIAAGGDATTTTTTTKRLTRAARKAAGIDITVDTDAPVPTGVRKAPTKRPVNGTTQPATKAPAGKKKGGKTKKPAGKGKKKNGGKTKKPATTGNAAAPNTAPVQPAPVVQVVNQGPQTGIQGAANNAVAPIRPQTKSASVLGEELRKELEKQKKQPFLWGTQIPTPEENEVDKDLNEYGFTPDQITTMKAKRTLFRVDGTAQKVFPGNGMFVEGTGPLPVKRVRKPAGKKYQNLAIYEDKEWVLFDHLQGYPEQFGTPPLSITKWASFEPDNQRIILQHTKTKALKSQTVPEALRGKTVDYTPSGPRIADFEPIKKRKKMVVAPEEPAPQEPSAPTLPPRESKRLKTAALSPIPEAEEATPTPLVAVPPATAGKKRKAEETTTSEAQEPKKKRRPGRPKLTPARVENSSSE